MQIEIRQPLTNVSLDSYARELLLAEDASEDRGLLGIFLRFLERSSMSSLFVGTETSDKVLCSTLAGVLHPKRMTPRPETSKDFVCLVRMKVIVTGGRMTVCLFLHGHVAVPRIAVHFVSMDSDLIGVLPMVEVCNHYAPVVSRGEASEIAWLRDYGVSEPSMVPTNIVTAGKNGLCVFALNTHARNLV